jgi:hypothetical protein
MKTIVSKIQKTWENGSPVLPTSVFIGIGRLTFAQLSKLRHRGAFSTVSLTFARCCQLTQHQHPNNKPNFDILKEWYKVGVLYLLRNC